MELPFCNLRFLNYQLANYLWSFITKLPVDLLNYSRHRTRLHNSNNSDGEEFNEVIDEDPIPSTSADQDATNTRRIVNSIKVYSIQVYEHCLYRGVTTDTRRIFHLLG